MEEREEMKFISWNVNGIRACVQKGFMDFFKLNRMLHNSRHRAHDKLG